MTQLNSDLTNLITKTGWTKSFSFTATKASGGLYLFVICGGNGTSSEIAYLYIANTAGSTFNLGKVSGGSGVVATTNGLTITFSTTGENFVGAVLRLIE